MRQVLFALAFGAALAACGSPAPSSPPATATATRDAFRLDLTVDRSLWKAGDLVTGTATLSNTGGATATIYGSGMGPVVFVFAEVGGSRTTGNVISADCGERKVPAGAPLTAQLHASAASGTGDDPWIASANDPSGARLPAGTWDVSAQAHFYMNGDFCEGTEVLIEAKTRVTVLP